MKKANFWTQLHKERNGHIGHNLQHWGALNKGEAEGEEIVLEKAKTFSQ